MKTQFLDTLEIHAVDQAIAAVERALRPYTVRHLERAALRDVCRDLYTILADDRALLCDTGVDGPMEKLLDAWGFLTEAVVEYHPHVPSLERALVALRQVRESVDAG